MARKVSLQLLVVGLLTTTALSNCRFLHPSVHALGRKIVEALQQIPQDMIRRSMNNFRVRIQKAIDVNGEYQRFSIFKDCPLRTILEMKNIYDLDKNFYGNSHCANAFQVSR